ncbi:BatD family protein, partial [Nitratifractor sp.]
MNSMKQNVWKRWGILFLLLGTLLWAGSVRTQVSSTRVSRGQSVTVKLIAEGSKVRFPSIEKIGKYPVENLRRSSKLETRFVNGKFSSKQQRILSFDFYPDKKVTIPPFRVEVDGKVLQTQPVDVDVVAGGSAATAGPVAGFALRMRADKKKLYVGEPLILTVDAVEPLNGSIVQMQYSPPKFKDFFVKPLGGEKRLRQGNATVHELRYLLIPNRPGKLQIPPAQVRIGIRDLQAVGDPFGIFGTPLTWYSIRSRPLSIEVRPLPVSADLVGNFTIEAHVDKKTVPANKPVNYILTIRGEGSLEDLPDPSFDIPGVTVYSDAAEVKSRLVGEKLESVWRKSYAFISDRDFTIPALTLKEFDPQSGKLKKITAPAIAVHVTGGSSAAAARTGRAAAGRSRAPVAVPAAASSLHRAAERNGTLLTDEAYYARKAYEEKAARLPWYLAGAFAAGVALAALFCFFYRKFSARPRRHGLAGRHYKPQEALKILYPHINEDPEAEAMVRLLYRLENGEEVELDRKALDRLAAKYDRSIRS